ncbi:MAG: hypothetical protein WD575_03635 [Nitriliruptoraceae bacterium]
MTILQTWIVAGIPGLVVVAALFAGRSRVRAVVGYGALGALVLVFFVTPGGGMSAAALAAVAAVLVALGRGTHLDGGTEHHEARRRFTTAGG